MDEYWFSQCMHGFYGYVIDDCFHGKQGFMCMHWWERSLCGLGGKCPFAWSWSWHLWPTVVEWHRWDKFIYMDWVCLEGSWKGMTLLRHGNIELIMVHHMSEFKPTPRVGMTLKIMHVKIPWWFQSRPRPRFLRGNGFRQSQHKF